MTARVVLDRGSVVADSPTGPPTKHLVVIPAYNEEASLAGTIAALQTLPEAFDVLVVNDGSLDRTAEVAEAAVRTWRRPVHVLHLSVNSGIGATVQTGYQFARARGCYEYVIQCDADGQHDPEDIPALVAECRRAGLDLCIGSRFLGEVGGGYQGTFWRRIGIRFFAWLIGRLSGARVTDPTSGFRCAGPRAWARFAHQYPEDYPEPESLFWCVRNGLRVGEVPVRMRPRAGGVSSIVYLRTGYYMTKVSLAIMIDRLRAQGA
ncbi:MAG: glycosyltransferase family 2 protein [Gemmataceae bacterium]|nr:glycosyltransferase family 2 protein [Gemmataceae bacterium]